MTEHSRQQRRRLQRLGEKVDQHLDADRNFFKRRPDRSYRVRQSFPAEIEFNCALGDAEDRPSEGSAWFTAVRQIGPGVWLRGFFRADSRLEADLLDEATCRQIYEGTAAATSKAREIERALEAAIAGRARQ